MPRDPSEGWDEVAERFMATRSTVGVDLVVAWSRQAVPPAGSILDVGCGSGVPITRALMGEGFDVFAIDASPTLVAAFRDRCPGAKVACEAAQDGAFFDRTFDAVVSVGLLFLLAEDDQREVIRRIAAALRPEGRLLFSAPRERCEWSDALTGRRSISLGSDEYERLLDRVGLRFVGRHVDDGHNNYYDAVKPAA